MKLKRHFRGKNKWNDGDKQRNTGNWEKLKNGISLAADDILDKRKLVPRKPWMNNKILALTEEINKLRKIGDHIG